MTQLCVAIVHYHLRPGGVTSVIGQAKAALEGRGIQVAVFSGTPPGQTPVSLRHTAHWVEGLGYGQGCPGTPPAPDVLLERLRKTAAEAFGRKPDIWHFHNHSMGKNPALTAAVSSLAAQGEPLLLQIHDFPEDGRPSNYRTLADWLANGDPERLGLILYPAAPQVHYAVINGRDRKFLLYAGLPEKQVHLLSNPVSMETVPDLPAPCSGRYIYPTRAIRRKNIGEFLLLAAIAEPGQRFAVTLAPTTPESRSRYEEWVSFASRRDLPVDFEAGKAHAGPFYSLLRQSSAIVTTSVAEGFGLAFLEPWLAQRPLRGRDIPEITRDFTEQGIRFNSLYTTLEIPTDWLPMPLWSEAVQKGIAQTYAAYGQKAPTDAAERACAAAMGKDGIDFGHLDEELQREAIRHVLRDKESRENLRQRFWAPVRQSETDIEHNRKIVRTQYRPDAYASRLAEVYSAIVMEKTAPPTAVSARHILDSFLSPERFLLLRT
jgi:glycosyltransferase involved in cell wall biosynthesis